MDISLKNHHNALEDAEACAQIVMKALYIDRCLSLWEYIAKGGCNFKYFADLKIRNYMDKREKPVKKPVFEHVRVSDIHRIVDCVDESCPLCGKNIVFTGQLSMPREEAMQIAVNHGAVIRSSVSKRTDFLVVGQQDKALVGDDGLSTKEEKAYELNESGEGHIKFLSEDEFIALTKNQALV